MTRVDPPPANAGIEIGQVSLRTEGLGRAQAMQLREALPRALRQMRIPAVSGPIAIERLTIDPWPGAGAESGSLVARRLARALERAVQSEISRKEGRNGQ